MRTGSTNLTMTFALLLGFAMLPDPVARGQCEPEWAGGFGLPGVGRYHLEGSVGDMLVFDDGTGAALYAVGLFYEAAGSRVDHVARWDGLGWTALGDGIPGAFFVGSIVVFDDGSGPAIYVGGLFSEDDGAPGNNVAKWDGANWSPLGSGTDRLVRDLIVFDDGAAPALLATGYFLTAGGETANRIAKWDGQNWSALGVGLNSFSEALTVWDDGSGPDLYVGGLFTEAGGIPTRGIARWNGVEWSGFPNGDFPVYVYAFAPFDDGGGEALYVGGYFWDEVAQRQRGIKRWDGVEWSNLGEGANSYVYSLGVFDDGDGPALYVGGVFSEAGGEPANRIASWDGAAWSAVGDGMDGQSIPRVFSLAVYDEGNGPALFAGGVFDYSDDVQTRGIARWKGDGWTALGQGIGTVAGSDYVLAMSEFDDGGGSKLYAGGKFSLAGGGSANGIASWDGDHWSPLRDGVGGDDPIVHAMTIFDDGRGPSLFVGGEFVTAGARTVNHVARWNGLGWTELGNGTDGHVFALAVYDDGSGPVLYVGGSFSTAGGVSAAGIARWDGLEWTPLRAGIVGLVQTLQVFDDGSGDGLFVAGFITRAGNQEVSHLAKWNGSRWFAVEAGADRWIHAMTVFDDGGGRALYVGGEFSNAGGQPANRIARWDGADWSPLGSGLAYPGKYPLCTALGVFDDGTGPALYVGGEFSLAGGAAAANIAKWTGDAWVPLADGIMSNASYSPTPVAAMTTFDNGTGSSLYLGGDLYAAGPNQSNNIARWGCPPEPCDPCDMNCDGSIDAFDIEPFLDLLFGPGEPCAPCTGDVDGNGEINAFDSEPFLECLFP